MKIWLIALISAPLIFLSCKGKSQNAGEIGARIHVQKQTSEYRVPVRVAVVHQGPIQEKITIYGKLTAKQETLLSSQFAGRILNLSLSEGDRVVKEQVVATIQSPKAEALQQAVSKNLSGEQNLSKELIPISIRAPFTGIVTKKFHYSGDVVSASEPILKIQDDSIFHLWGQLPAAYLPDVQIGQKIKITFPDLHGMLFQGNIEAINSAVDLQTQMAQIRASLPNPHHFLKSDLLAKIDITVKSLKNALLVPRNAVLVRDEVPCVFLKKNGKAYLQTVRVGIKNPAMFSIKSGLAVGDSVIVLGNYELKDNMAVEVMH